MTLTHSGASCSASRFTGQAEIGTLPLSELALVLVRLNHVASVIVNANHSIM